MRCVYNSVQFRLIFKCGMDLKNLFHLHRTRQIERIVRRSESSQQRTLSPTAPILSPTNPPMPPECDNTAKRRPISGLVYSLLFTSAMNSL